MTKPENRDEQDRPIGRFQKGVSGNPGGRPKESADVKDLARQHSSEAFSRILELMRSDNARVALAAAQEVMNRAWGKPEAHMHAKLDGLTFVNKIERVIVDPKPISEGQRSNGH